jgi:hypothetical protein
MEFNEPRWQVCRVLNEANRTLCESDVEQCPGTSAKTCWTLCGFQNEKRSEHHAKKDHGECRVSKDSIFQSNRESLRDILTLRPSGVGTRTGRPGARSDNKKEQSAKNNGCTPRWR